MEYLDILNEIGSIITIVKKDQYGNILYANTRNPVFFKMNDTPYFSEAGKYYKTEVKVGEKSSIYCYTDITDYAKDPLTGALNRLGFAMELDYINQNRDQFIVSLCDVDLFKNINDQYGHAGGDFVLCELSKTIKEYLGDRGCISRHGGDEFILVLYEEEEKSVQMLDELLYIIRYKPFEYSQDIFHITVTMGYAHFDKRNFPNEEGKPILTLTQRIDTTIREADQAMYKGKKEGRNSLVPFNVDSKERGKR